VHYIPDLTSEPDSISKTLCPLLREKANLRQEHGKFKNRFRPVKGEFSAEEGGKKRAKVFLVSLQLK